MKTVHVSGKRKQAIARATIKEGTGKVTINKFSLENYSHKIARMRIMEPLMIADKIAKKVDISINVIGGGQSSQAEASRLTVAKALVEYSKSSTLKEEFLKYDRHLLVADVRRKEQCKPNVSKARKKRQKSYR